MPTRVEGCGDSSAKLMLIGEAPGAQEESNLIPFCGASGDMIAEDLTEAGTSIHDIWRTNVVKVRPPDNDITRLHEIGYEVKGFYEELYKEINFVNPNCILLCGDTALTAVTGQHGILKWRGSIIRSKTNHKCVSTIHPAALFAHGDTKLPWVNRTIIKHDIERAVKQAQFPEIRLPSRNLLIAKSSLDVVRYLERWSFNPHCVVDVESYKTIPLCIGLAHSKQEAISIPLFSEAISDHEQAYIWRLIADYFRDPAHKLIAHNMKFDQKRCRQVGLNWANPYCDTSMAWHTLWSEMSKKLQFLTTFLTEEPYYKDEGKEYNPAKDKIDRLFLYNAKDCVVTYECFEVMMQDLIEANLYEFFYDQIMPLHKLYYDMEDVGLLQDQRIKKELTTRYEELRISKKVDLVRRIKEYGKFDEFAIKRRTKKEDNIKHIKIEDFNCDSPSQVAALLYGYLRCPVRKDTGEATLKALANNAVKDETRKEIIKGILEDRKIGKTIGTYLEAACGGYPIANYSPFTQ